jgi:hypothetical protein
MDEQHLPPPAPPAPPPMPLAAPKQTSTMAIVSLVSGILGWTLIPWLGSIVAIVTGHMARSEIKRNAETTEGDGLAITGLVLGWTSFLLGLLAILAVILFFGGIAVLLAGLGMTGHLN